MRRLFNRIKPTLIFSVCAALGAFGGVDAQIVPSVNLITNGAFASGSDKTLAGWSEITPSLPTTTGKEGSDVYVTVQTADPTSTSGIAQTVQLQPEWTRLLLRGYIRSIVGAGQSSPATGPFIGVQLGWLDKTYSPVGQITAQSWRDTTPGWVEVNQLLDVPPGARYLKVAPEVSDIAATAYFKTLSLTAWIPTFDERFNGQTLDSSKWSISTGRHNVAADEGEWFTPNNVSVANGMLDIHGAQQNINGYNYTSGQISTIGKFQQLYGLFEFDLKLPVTMGAWPAAYLLRYDDSWPPEIDVEELSGRDTGTVLETNHYADDLDQHHQSYVNFSAVGLDRTQWHHYAAVWEPGSVAWYIDGIYRGTTGEPGDHVSDDPMYITINLAIGWFGGDPSQSQWPQDFYCRAVDVYQRSDLQLPLFPEPSQEITLPNKTVILSALGNSPASDEDVKWTLAEGPGPVNIKNSSLLSTTATVSRAGMYRFRVTVAKGKTSNYGDLLVYVNKALGAT